MGIKIGDRVNLRNPFSNEVGEYELVSIHESGDYIFKGEGLTTQVITEQCLRYLVINKKVNNMNFIEAMKLLQLDKNIKLKRRNKDFEVTFVLISLNLTINDILAEDWYVVRDEKLHTFEEAIALLRKGKSIRRKAWTNRFSVDANDCFNNYSNYCFSTDDLDAKDWIIKERK